MDWLRASDSGLKDPGQIMCLGDSVYSTLLQLLRCMNEYLAIDTDGYLCKTSFRALTAAWLDASRRSRDGV